jgi:hypothetical protein
LGLYRHRIETKQIAICAAHRGQVIAEVAHRISELGDRGALGREFGGLVIRNDEIMDGLRREYLPEEFKILEYKGSRPQESKFGDVMYSGSGPF